jgi:hypothetical protein
MKAPDSSPPWLTVVTAAERPGRWLQALGAPIPRFAGFQAPLIDQRTDTIIARGRTIPFHWDGTLADPPSGIDATGLNIRMVHDTSGPGD